MNGFHPSLQQSFKMIEIVKSAIYREFYCSITIKMAI